jgi:hypothetical protein
MADALGEVAAGPKPEMKVTASPVVKETPEVKPSEAHKPGEAHATLEKIASGVPVLEATAKPEYSLNKEAAEKILKETNELLLDAKDMRLLVTAVASQAADTPLGNEMKVDALRMIGKMSNSELSPEGVLKLDGIQKQIAELGLPEAKPEQSALLTTIDAHNLAHPDQAIPPEVSDQIRSGKQDVAPTIAQLVQTNTAFGQEVWKQVTGVEGFTKLTPTPEIILDLTGLEKTPENLAKANAMFGKVQEMAQKPGFIENVMPGIMLSMLLIMFVSQIATGEGGGGGH